MKFADESELEKYIRDLIANKITICNKNIYLLNNKKAVDILICKDGNIPELFFLEIKYFKKSHGRLGFGGSKGGGFQPEILTKKPTYFESNLRWILGSEEHQLNGLIFINSDIVRKYVSGDIVSKKYNNIQRKIFNEISGYNENLLVEELKLWMKAK